MLSTVETLHDSALQHINPRMILKLASVGEVG